MAKPRLPPALPLKLWTSSMIIGGFGQLIWAQTPYHISWFEGLHLLFFGGFPKNKCRVPCPCQLCTKNYTFCKISVGHKTCEEPCLQFKEDFNDHTLSHVAHHPSCKFWLELFNIFPFLKFVVCCRERYTYREVYRPRWIFEHFVSDSEKYPDQNECLN